MLRFVYDIGSIFTSESREADAAGQRPVRVKSISAEVFAEIFRRLRRFSEPETSQQKPVLTQKHFLILSWNQYYKLILQ